MNKKIAILFLVSCLVFIGFQNCGGINPPVEDSSADAASDEAASAEYSSVEASSVEATSPNSPPPVCIGGPYRKVNSNYAVAKYCHADYDYNSSPQVMNQYLQCRASGIDVSNPGQGIYYINVRPDQYAAIEIKLPHPTFNPNKTLCGFRFMGEVGSACGGVPAAVDTWALSPNPGDFSGSCVTHTTAGGMWGRVRSNPNIEPNNNCLMDRGRTYYVNIKMDRNCRNPAGCEFLLMTSAIYTGATQYVNGQRYIVDNQCNLVRQP